MKQAIILLAAVTSLMACNSKKSDTGSDISEPAKDTMEITKVPAGNDSALIRGVIIDFYSWYTGHYQQLMRYKLYSSIKNNNGAPYQLNPGEVKKYLQFISDSIPQLGDAFVANHKKLFAKIDSAFKVDVKEDVPYYFDFDWYTNSQEEPSYLLEGIKKSDKWVMSIQGDDATVEIGSPEDKNYLAGSLLLFVRMKKENGQWTIAEIGND